MAFYLILIGGAASLCMLGLIAGAFIFLGGGDKVGLGFSPTIDATTDETLKSSIANVKESLSDSKRKEFEAALMTLMGAEIGNAMASGGLMGMAADPEGFQQRLRDTLHGKTASQVIANASSVATDRKSREREQIESEIKELEQEIAEAKVAKDQLKDFEVTRSRFYSEEGRFSSELIIDLTVKNNTPHAVSRAYFHGILRSPGRTIPWVEEDFNYEIPGGLEPGEEATWKLTPNRFGDWGKAPTDRDDLLLTVEVERIDGADGEAIYDADLDDGGGLQAPAEKRLESLREALNKL